MNAKQEISHSRGLIVPTLAVAMVALLGFIALAIDIGMIAVARTQSQNVADTAAMAGARALNGLSTGNYNTTGASTTAMATAKSNSIQAKPVTDSQVTVEIGSYTYDYSQNKFVTNIPVDLTKDTPNLVKSTITGSGQNLFGRMMGSSAFNLSSTATAVHRPRDVAVILDMSGSMRFDSLLGIPISGARTQSNNPESVYPQFGHYTSTSAKLQNTSTKPINLSDNTYGPANITVDTDAGKAIVGDFYQSALGATTPVPAFTLAAIPTTTPPTTAVLDSFATDPDGDQPLMKNGSDSTPGKTIQEITNGKPFLGYTATPYQNYSGPTVSEFQGYTRGPRYWGKTFFIWPPDPRSGKDWRQKFLGTADNSDLWDSNGWRTPSSSTYSINYTAILAWIKQTPNPFPPKLRAGRILYYDAIPSTISTSSYIPSDQNQRFWKLYIDYVLGLYQMGSNSWDVITSRTGYGDDFAWGTVKITAGNATPVPVNDNPERPKLHFWFGPMTMIDFLGNYNMWNDYGDPWTNFWPGNCHEGPVWACKLGIQAALGDIQKNHPNDFVSLSFFSTPKFSSSAAGSFNRIRVPLGRDYQRLSDTLWFPPSTIDSPGTEIRAFDDEVSTDVPHAIGGTTTVMGFMQAYNQLSGNSTLRTYAPSPAPDGEAGGFGRRGSQRLVILETDGMANVPASASFTNSGVANSYYKIRQPGEYPTQSGTVNTQIYSVVNQICALETASPPGYSTTRKPVLVHCIGVGPIFDPTNDNPQLDPVLDLMENIQYIGKTQPTASTPLQDYKMITGKSEDRTGKIRQAFSTIMQDGVQVSLIQ